MTAADEYYKRNFMCANDEQSTGSAAEIGYLGPTTVLRQKPVLPGEAWIRFWKMGTVWNRRSSRSEFWWAYLFLAISVICTMIIDVNICRGEFIWTGWSFLVWILPMTALQVRRLHDIGLSAWWVILALIPSAIGQAFPIVVGLVPSARNTNKWGPVPNLH